MYGMELMCWAVLLLQTVGRCYDFIFYSYIRLLISLCKGESHHTNKNAGGIFFCQCVYSVWRSVLACHLIPDSTT